MIEDLFLEEMISKAKEIVKGEIRPFKATVAYYYSEYFNMPSEKVIFSESQSEWDNRRMNFIKLRAMLYYNMYIDKYELIYCTYME